MSETTTITIKLTHAKALTNLEFANLTRSIIEHIEGEQKEDPGYWGFFDITRIEAKADHSMLPGIKPDRRWGYDLDPRNPAHRVSAPVAA